MEENTSEREQLEQIRKWWDANGKALIVGLAFGLTALLGYRYWQNVQESTAESASLNYQHFLQLAGAGPGDEPRSAGQAIIDGYPDTAYARMTALLLARLEMDDNKPEEAKRRLQWVIDTGGDSELALIARSRLAQVLLAEGKAEAALAEIERAIPKGKQAPDEPLFAEIRGDILAALGRNEEAAKMYDAAIAQFAKLETESPQLQLKRDALGIEASRTAAK